MAIGHNLPPGHTVQRAWWATGTSLQDAIINSQRKLKLLMNRQADGGNFMYQISKERRRLKGLQFRVDLERRRAPTPLAATIRISEMMCRSLADLHASFVTPAAPDEAAEESLTASGVLDNVVPFPRR